MLLSCHLLSIIVFIIIVCVFFIFFLQFGAVVLLRQLSVVSRQHTKPVLFVVYAACAHPFVPAFFFPARFIVFFLGGSFFIFCFVFVFVCVCVCASMSVLMVFVAVVEAVFLFFCLASH